MSRVFLPLGLLVAFGLGLAVGGYWSDAGEVARLQAAARRLEGQIGTLQARLRVSEAKVSAQGAAAGSAIASRGGLEGDATRSSSVAALAGDGRAPTRARARNAGPPRGEPQDDLTPPAVPVRGAASSPATVETALQRFYRYLDETAASGGQGRWGSQLRELVNDLRAMGDAGTEALMRVLADGTNSDARRAAAQLLGQLQVPEAVPLLQNILDNDSDVLLRRAAASALRRLDLPEAVPTMQALLSDPGEDRFVRMSAAYGLAQQGQALGVIGLEQIFQESSIDGRGHDIAFRALASLNDPAALPFMRQLVTSNADVSYRLQAIRFVTAQGDGQALGPLQQVMQSPTEQPSIRDAAAQAYATISGR
jgi:hypothetical protein